MALDSGMVGKTIRAGVAKALENGGSGLKLTATLTANIPKRNNGQPRRLTWAGTGNQWHSAPTTLTVNEGEEVTFADVPATNSTGWRLDGQAPELGPTDHVFTYTLSVSAKQGAKTTSMLTATFTIAENDPSSIDVDTLMEAATTSGAVVSIVDNWTALTEAAAASAAAAEVAAAGNDAGVSALIETPATATRTALDAAFGGYVSAAAYGFSPAASGAENLAALQGAADDAIAAGVPLHLPAGGTCDVAGTVNITGALAIVGPGRDQLTIHQTTKPLPVFYVTAPSVSITGLTFSGENLDMTGLALNGASSFRRYVGVWATTAADDLRVSNVRAVDLCSAVLIGTLPGQAYSDALDRARITDVEVSRVWVGVVGGPVTDARVSGVAGTFRYCTGAPSEGDVSSPPHLVYISSDTAHPSSQVSVENATSVGVTAAGGVLKLKHMSGARASNISAKNCTGLVELEEVTDSTLSALTSTSENYPTTGDNRGAVWLVNCQRVKINDPLVSFASINHGVGIWMNSQCADIEINRPRITANRATASTTVYGIRTAGAGIIVREPVMSSIGAAIQAGIFAESSDGRIVNPVASGAHTYGIYARAGRQLVAHDSAGLLPSRSVAAARALGSHADALTAGTMFRDAALGQPVVAGFSDTFDRADVQTLGYTDTLKPWRYFGLAGEFNGTWQIAGNAAQYAGGSARGLALVDGGKADGTLTAVIGSLPATVADGLAVRVVDANNYVAVLVDPTTFRPVLQKRVAGTSTTVFSAGAGTEIAPGDTVGVVCSGTSISVTRNGTEVIAPQAVTDFATATMHGILGVTGGTSSKVASIAFA